MATKATEKHEGLRAALIEVGYSVRSFALKFHYPISTAYAAANETRAGVKARKIRNHMLRTTQCAAKPSKP